MRVLRFVFIAVVALILVAPVLAQPSFHASPFVFDPGKTGTVSADWVKQIGLPDVFGENNYGLLLSKNAFTTTVAAPVVEIRGVKGITLTELGYDVRNGGHCGAGAPRFNVVTADGVTHFIGCASPPPSVSPAPPTADGATTGWQRLRWTNMAAAFPPIAAGSTVQSLFVLFDEGVDTGPDFSGMVVIDNIDLNGALIGQP